MNPARSTPRMAQSYRQRAGERFARRRWPAPAPSAAARLRLQVLRDELALASDEKDAAKLMLILAEGLHEGVFRTVTYIVRRPLIAATIELDGPPHCISFRRTMPLGGRRSPRFGDDR